MKGEVIHAHKLQVVDVHGCQIQACVVRSLWLTNNAAAWRVRCLGTHYKKGYAGNEVCLSFGSHMLQDLHLPTSAVAAFAVYSRSLMR